tara:strand:+ start:509 stop:1210 length:702 start_codon:yes stop_codon:yes gene_type:complete
MENRKKRKNIVGIASIPNRVEGLKDTIKCLSPQVDHIYVWLNGYEKVPKVEETNVTFHLSFTNDGAIAKLKLLESIKEDNFYYFTCDDDILYPSNYIEHNLSVYEPGSIQSSHAKIFNSFPITDYAYGDTSGFYFGNEIQNKVPVHIVGTGVGLMDSDVAKQINYKEFSTSNMLDVWISCWAQQTSTPMYVTPHPGGWLLPNNIVNQENSIWSQVIKSDQDQIRLINHYFTKT